MIDKSFSWLRLCVNSEVNKESNAFKNNSINQNQNSKGYRIYKITKPLNKEKKKKDYRISKLSINFSVHIPHKLYKILISFSG